MTKEEKSEKYRAWLAAHPGYHRERHRAKKDELNAKRRAYRKARSRPFPSALVDRSEYQRAYREANREKLRERHKKHVAANKEKCDARSRAWRKAHPEYFLAAGHRRRSRKRGAPGTGWKVADVRAQYDAQSGKCYYCKCELGKRYHRDHVIPLAKGGHHCRSNLVLACVRCNCSKSDKDPQEFAGILL